ncbi:pyruvate dehydrogenase (acetyl-transferring), homodimeric type, partial [Actinomadura adrarensis]
NELAREAAACDDWNLLHPDSEQHVPYVTRALENAAGPIVAVSDFMRAVPDQIAPWIPGDYSSLGTDGFGFSDTRAAARRFFNVDAASIVLAVLTRLARHGEVKPETLQQAIERYQLNADVSTVFAGGVGSAESNTGGDA